MNQLAKPVEMLGEKKTENVYKEISFSTSSDIQLMKDEKTGRFLTFISSV